MTAQEYLEGLLADQKLSDEQKKYLKNVRGDIEEFINQEYHNEPIIFYAGSYGKCTMIRASYDLDLLIYFPHTYPRAIRNIYNHLYQKLCDGEYEVERKKEGVSLKVRIPWKPGISVDVVPGKAKDPRSKYAHLYKHGTNTRKPTSRKVHIDTVKHSNCRAIIKLMKLWKIRHNIQSWKSFHLELLVIKALKGYKNKNDYDKSLKKVFEFIQKAEIKDWRVVDPANGSTVIEIHKSTCKALKKAAAKSLNFINAENWNKVIW